MAEAEAQEATELPRSNGKRSFFLSGVILSHFVLLFSLIGVLSFLQKSPTVDEPIHLFAGHSYLKWGDFRANPEHPPFAKIWAALPLLAFDVKDTAPSNPLWDLIPESVRPAPTRDLAEEMFFAANDGEALFFYAKLQMIFLGMLLGIFVYVWSRELFGLKAALAALFIFALDPNILAHSQLVHTDVPFTAFFFIGTYFFWRTLNRGRWTDFGLACLCFALACVTKYSWVAIVPIWGTLGLAKIFSISPAGSPGRGKKALLSAGVLACAGMAAYVFVWAAYGFRFEAIPGGPPLHIDWVMPPEHSPLRAVATFISERRIFPEAWIYGQLYVLKYLQRHTFLLGQYSPDGFWSYFPVTFAAKTPVPTMIVLILAVGMLIRGRIGKEHGFFLLIPPALYFSFVVASRANLGVRYILPIYPFLFVLAGGAVARLLQGERWIKAGVTLLAVWSLWSCVGTYPHYLAYFNELVGGPKNGHHVLLDSNLDWGQDLKGLKRWMDAHGVNKIEFLYFGAAPPEFYGIDATYMQGSWFGYDPPATRTAEAPRYVAMSAELLYGLSRENDLVQRYRSREPVASIGHSIFIYGVN